MAKHWREYQYNAQMAIERLDVLEDFPAKGNGLCCNVRNCRRQIVASRPGPFTQHRLCSVHLPLYDEQDRILERIRKVG